MNWIHVFFSLCIKRLPLNNIRSAVRFGNNFSEPLGSKRGFRQKCSSSCDTMFYKCDIIGLNNCALSSVFPNLIKKRGEWVWKWTGRRRINFCHQTNTWHSLTCHYVEFVDNFVHLETSINAYSNFSLNIQSRITPASRCNVGLSRQLKNRVFSHAHSTIALKRGRCPDSMNFTTDLWS